MRAVVLLALAVVCVTEVQSQDLESAVQGLSFDLGSGVDDTDEIQEVTGGKLTTYTSSYSRSPYSHFYLFRFFFL